MTPPDGAPGVGGAATWTDDVLGPPFQVLTLALAPDEEGDVVATLVRYRPDARGLAALGQALRGGRRWPRRRFAVLYLHGWNDYFFQTELARFWDDLGGAFYALDLRKYGRSLREHHTPGFVEDLEAYDEDVAAALAAMDADGAPGPLVLVGHSTGGLVAALWAHRHPGRVAGLVLNAPWLEVLGASFVRAVSMPLLEQIARRQPKVPLPNVDPGFYGRSIAGAEGGVWAVDPRWRAPVSAPATAGWLLAVARGHAQVAQGLELDAPVLVLLAERSLLSRSWSEAMNSADVVLDVDVLARRALDLGPVVTVARIPGAVHDVVLSAEPARSLAYDEVRRWARGYLEA